MKNCVRQERLFTKKINCYSSHFKIPGHHFKIVKTLYILINQSNFFVHPNPPKTIFYTKEKKPHPVKYVF